MHTENSKTGDKSIQLLNKAIRFNAKVLGLVSGVLAGVFVYAATLISLLKWGDNAGEYLGLLAVFLPGYSVSYWGAFIGAFWGFVFGGLAGFQTYWLYGRILKEKLSSGEISEDPVFAPAVLRLHGMSLGLAIGSSMGFALFVSTSFLVLRGTADESTNAALLSNYLPGYSVSITGALLGAVELIVLMFVACSFLALIYNKIVDVRLGMK